MAASDFHVDINPVPSLVKHHSGFTLIELIVVISILVMAYAVIPPITNNVMAGTKVKSATRQLVSALRYSRSNAITLQKEMALILNVEENSYSIGNKTKHLDIPGESVLKLTTAKSEQLSETEGAIRFFPDGSSTGGQVALKEDEDSAEYIIDINWLTGKISILP